MDTYDYYAVLVQTQDGSRYWCGVRDPETGAKAAHRRMVLGPVQVGLHAHATEEEAFAALMLWHGPSIEGQPARTR